MGSGMLHLHRRMGWRTTGAWLAATMSLLACDPARPEPPPPPAATPVAPIAEAPTAVSADEPPPEPAVALKPGGDDAVEGRWGMVSSEDDHATRAGVEILERGGNAVDAAIAVAYALSATHHAAGSLGGGGFMIVRLKSGETFAIDYREKAPAKATVALNEKQLREGAHGYLSAAVPGVVAGLELARQRFGTLPREALLEPAIRLAREGHPYGARHALVLGWYWKRIKDRTFKATLGRGGDAIGPGRKLVQPELATTLEAIAKNGRDGFYGGEVAKQIAQAMARHGGLVTEADLRAYEAKVREPLSFRYRGLEVHTMPPPSMGGIALYSMMHHLAAAKAHEVPVLSAEGLHLFAEAARRAYADRRAIGADPDFQTENGYQPLRTRLLAGDYYAAYQPKIDPAQVTASKSITPIHAEPEASPESPDTTHFSVVDAEGNAVSCTTTLSAAFGAWVMVPGTGVILSNVMGAFSPDGVNALAPGKRMASSMTPTLVVRHGETVAVIGSPGGDTIPGTVAQVLRNLVDGQMTIDQAIDAPRIHHQYRPDELRMETNKPIANEARAGLAKLGHTVKASPLPLGDANGIVRDPESGTSWGFSDRRKGGLALGPSKR